MNRTDRLLAIVLELQGRGRARAEDLARHFGVAKRTIYRDVLALNEAGVPILSVPGRGYSLMEGYFLPPLRFDAEEAVMLVLGTDAVAPAFDASPAEAARRAASKILAVLAPDVREEAAFLRENLRLVQRDPGGEAARAPLAALRRAIVERRVVAFRYRKPGAAPEARLVEPHGLYRLDAVWMLSAHEEGRDGPRSFRLDRMEGVEVTAQRFERRPGFRLARDEAREGRDTAVRVLLDPDAPEPRPSFFEVAREDAPEGRLVTLRVRRVEDVLGWVLACGGAVRVLEPEALRERVREEARRLLDRHA